MKTTTVIFIAAILLFLPSSLYAQKGLRYELHTGMAFIVPTRSVLSNWDDGWTLGFGVAYQIYPNIQIVPSVSYQQFRYTGQNLQLVFPHIAGLRWSAAGKPSQAYETSFALRFIAPGKFIKPFIFFKGGAYFITIGEILITTWFQDHPQDMYRSLYRGSGTSITKGLISLGYGINIPINSALAIQFETGYAQTFDENDANVFFSFRSAVQIGL